VERRLRKPAQEEGEAMSSDWKGRVAVITGGGSGIGLAMARGLAREGVDLVLASRKPERLAAAAASLQDTGRRVLTVPCDVADRAQVYALAERAIEAFGKVDLLCANAGATTAGLLADHRDEDWDWSIDINLRGVTNCVQAFYPAMAARGSGTILLTSSQTALAPDWVRNHGPYIAAKAAVVALAMSLRAEAAELGVAVSLLVPSGSDTEIISQWRRVPGAETASIMPYAEAPPPRMDLPFMLSPEEIAERALDGLRRNAPIIVTHAGMKPVVEHYFARILDAYDAAEAFQPQARPG
jgi:NAD(P)-dependent dehydrogenase (short-subunit alcohol dehydrogenase family)